MIQSVQQKPTDLILANTTQFPSSITVLKQQSVSIGAWSFMFQIIGESHIVTVTYKQKSLFHEMLACVKINADHCQHHHPFSELQTHTYMKGLYQVSVEFAETPSWDIPKQTETDHIEVNFPPICGQTPVTRILWQLTDNILSWWTLHVYPERDITTFVHTKSHIQLT